MNSTIINGISLSSRTVSYLETALWSSTVMLPCAEDELIKGYMNVESNHPLHGINESDNLDDHFSIHDITPDTLQWAEKEVFRFFEMLEEMNLYEQTSEHGGDETIAHDLWLTQNHHGMGFWYGDYGKIGKVLTSLCQKH